MHYPTERRSFSPHLHIKLTELNENARLHTCSSLRGFGYASPSLQPAGVISFYICHITSMARTVSFSLDSAYVMRCTVSFK